MFSVFSALRKPFTRLALLSLGLVLASCASTGPGGPSINTSRPVPVALLVPGGSANPGDEVLARSLENAARLAMADLDGVTIDLRVYNTAGQAGQAAEAARQAVNDGARIILGPVFAEAANAAGVAVAARGINVLAFSNNTAIAGNNVFVLGPTFQNTANRLVSYAVSQGKGSFMVVYGEDPAETVGRDAILAAIGRAGGTLAGTASFEVTQEGVINAVRDIAAATQESGAQSLFLTSGTSGALPFLAQLLPENGLGPETIQYIGLQRWDIPATALTLPGLQGGWFALPDPDLNNRFTARYEEAYGTPPHPIAGLAYDGIAAIGALVRAGKSDALTRRALTQAAGFAGVNGVFRLLPDGTNERGLAVAQIQDNQVTVIDPAPRSFGGTGF